MNGNNSNYSRIGRKKRKNRGNQLLNIMIGLVVVLIVIVGANIFMSSNDDKKDQVANQDEQGSIDENFSEEDANTDDGSVTDDKDDSNANDEVTDDGGSDSAGAGTSGNGQNDDEGDSEDTVTTVPNDEEIVVETIVDAAWKPIGTVQTGEHVSIYNDESVDWDEKKEAIAYATKFPVESLIYWKIKNGGGPQKSIGIVSTRDKSEKFRVYLEWVDGQGWKPVKMDILNTLDFEY
ncbi:DUF1510 family protein [Sporosarcina sp. FSL W8-0480]|uniref:YrrS family protein n=1 Tax=Sporosarcina sp. FSL W8-0480 TaxID=2954701 RepID=UPI0030D7A8A7